MKVIGIGLLMILVLVSLFAVTLDAFPVDTSANDVCETGNYEGDCHTDVARDVMELFCNGDTRNCTE